MQRYEYRVLPAPTRGVKAKGVRSPEDRFAHALMILMNDMGREGWEYLRADTLPCEERVGLTGRSTKFRNMLVFRRPIAATPATSEAPAATVEARPAPLVPPTIADPEAGVAPPAANAPAAPLPAAAPVTLRAAESSLQHRAGEAAGLSAGRLAATLTARAPAGPAPKLAPIGEAGAAPRLGAARGKGLPRPGDPGYAAE